LTNAWVTGRSGPRGGSVASSRLHGIRRGSIAGSGSREVCTGYRLDEGEGAISATSGPVELN
jgi:hypothetical protein